MEQTSFVTLGDGTRLAYRLEGAADRPVLLLANSIATDLHMWDDNMPDLTRHFRVLRYDFRGHGLSDAPVGAYSLDRLGRDVLELMDALGIARAHVLGLSLGGYVAQWLAIHAPERVMHLVLANTAAYLGPARMHEEAIAQVLQAPSLAAAADTFVRNWFPAQWVDEARPVVERFRQGVERMSAVGLAGARAAVRDADLRRTIGLIAAPTLVIAGRNDGVTTLAHSEEIAAAVPGARLCVLPAVHLSNVEQPQAFASTVLEFLSAA
jgi:3-oxoadipate enol-lactonase